MEPVKIPPAMPWLLGEVEEVAEKLKLGRVLIAGGRGTGKSTILARIMDASPDAGEGLYLACRDTPAARQELRDAVAAKKQYATIYIDDLDVLLTAGESDRPEDIQEIVGWLWTLIHNQIRTADASPVVLATTSIEFQGPLAHRLAAAIEDGSGANRTVDAISRLRELFGKYRLTPWPKSWDEEWWNKEFRKEFRERIAEPQLTWWADGIMELTGGHIGLWGPSVKELSRLIEEDELARRLAEEAKQAADEASKERAEEQAKKLTDFERQLIGRGTGVGVTAEEHEEWGEAVRRYVEDFLSVEHVLPIRGALRRLKDSSEALERASYESLVAIARRDGDVGSRPPEDATIRSILRDEGLVMVDSKTGRMRIPGSMLEGLILRSVVRAQASVEVVTDAKDPDQGELRIQSASGEDRVVLVGAPWRVLRELYKRQGDIVSASELRDRAELADDKRAVTNAMQRLMMKLKPVDHEHLIANVYNRGYKFVGK